MAEIRHLENRHDVIFFWRGWSDLDKNFADWCRMTCRLRWCAWSKSKQDVEFQYGGRFGEFHGMSSQSHVLHCRVLPLAEFTVMIPEPHATLHMVLGAMLLTWLDHIWVIYSSMLIIMVCNLVCYIFSLGSPRDQYWDHCYFWSI